MPSAIGLSAGGFAACGGETCDCTPPPEADCSNGTDDDGNGRTDCADPACAGTPACTTETACGNGFDDDGDGAIDCVDCDCAGHPPCLITILPCF